MSLQLVYDIWDLVKDSILDNDRTDIAETLVGTLMDYGFALDDIKTVLGSDPDISLALEYLDESEDSHWDDERSRNHSDDWFVEDDYNDNDE